MVKDLKLIEQLNLICNDAYLLLENDMIRSFYITKNFFEVVPIHSWADLIADKTRSDLVDSYKRLKNLGKNDMALHVLRLSFSEVGEGGSKDVYKEGFKKRFVDNESFLSNCAFESIVSEVLAGETEPIRLRKIFYDEFLNDRSSYPKSWVKSHEDIVRRAKNECAIDPEAKTFGLDIFERTDVMAELARASFESGAWYNAILQTVVTPQWLLAIEREKLLMISGNPCKQIDKPSAL